MKTYQKMEKTKQCRTVPSIPGKQSAALDSSPYFLHGEPSENILETHLAVDEMEKLLKAGILHEGGSVFWLVRQQARKLNEHEGRVVFLQAATATEQLQELLWLGGLLDDLLHLPVPWVGGGRLLLLHKPRQGVWEVGTGAGG